MLRLRFAKLVSLLTIFIGAFSGGLDYFADGFNCKFDLSTASASAGLGDTFLYLPLILNNWQGAWLRGKVVDTDVEPFKTPEPIPEVQLCTQDNECATTNDNGEYEISLSSAGLKNLTAQKIGYITATQPITTVANETVELNFGLSSLGLVPKVRVVLMWDSNHTFPFDGGTIDNDLDAWLVIEESAANKLIYYGNPGDCDTPPSSCLVYDVSDGLGPEIIDIFDFIVGDTYHFGVSAADDRLPSFSELNARVCINFDGEENAVCFAPPPGDLKFWYVFSMNDAGTVTPKNCLTARPNIINNNQVEEIPSCP